MQCAYVTTVHFVQFQICAFECVEHVCGERSMKGSCMLRQMHMR